MDKKTRQNTNTYVVIVGAIIILSVMMGAGTKMLEVSSVQGDWDISSQVSTAGLEKYLVEESDFDYSNPQVYAMATKIKQSTASANDALQKTARFVYDNVQYNSRVTVASCYAETASSTLSSGQGDCVSMSRLATALLRAQGIPARTVGGCLTSVRGCSPSFAIFPTAIAKVTPITDDMKKRGFLHEWVEVWTPEKGWQILEATAGSVFSQECDSYLEYGYDSNSQNRCVINDRAFWNKCKLV